MYPSLYRSLRLFWKGGYQTRRNSQELQKTEWISQSELLSLQFDKILRLVRYAYDQVPFYRELYQNHGIHPDDIKDLEDFQKLPMITRQNINENLNRMVAPEYRDKVQLYRTSGSSGEPMRFYLDDSIWWWNKALEFRGRSWYGVKEGDKTAWIWLADDDIKNKNLTQKIRAFAMQERYMDAHNMTKGKFLEFASFLKKWQPKIIIAYPTAAALFASFLKLENISGIHPNIVETSSEKLTISHRKILEDVFNCKAVDNYSSRELTMIAYQCEKGSLHVVETKFLEIMNNDQPANPGEKGEVVITSLYHYSMPFIRYKNGDMAILGKNQCVCGRGLPVLEEVYGRKEDFIVTQDGKIIYPSIEQIIGNKSEIIRFQGYQPDKTHFELRLVCKHTIESAWIKDINKKLQAYLGENMQINIVFWDDIPLTERGKHRVIMSDVKPDFQS